jgi:hypothetical protein
MKHLLLLLMLAGCALAAVPKHHNSLGTVSYESNPYTYRAGAVVTGFDIDEGKGLVIRIQPIGTYNLFSEDILFCGNPIDKLEGLHNPILLTYATLAHRTVRGVGCHELLRADEVKDGLLSKTR